MKSLLRSLARKLMMLDPGYRKAHFLEKKLEARSDELLAAVRSAEAAARAATARADEVLAATRAAADRAGEAIAAARATAGEALAAAEGARAQARETDGLLRSYLDYVNPEVALVRPDAPAGARRILLVGFYGGNNLGDELMLRAILKCAGDFPRARFTVMLAENPDYDIAQLGDVDVVHYCRTASDLSHLAARFDALFVGGGALLDDRAYPSSHSHFKSLSYIVAELPRHFTARGKAVVCYGLSANERIGDAAYAARLASAVAGADYFSVRDGYSLAALKACGVDAGKVRLVEDIVLSDPDIAAAPVRRGGGDGAIVFGVVWVAFEELRRPLVEVLRRLLALEGKYGRSVRVRLIPFYDFVHADLSFYRSAVGELPPEDAARVEVAGYDNGLAATVARFDGCDAMVNMRYHAALVCGARGVPQVMLVLSGHPHYPAKMKWAGERFGARSRLMDAGTDAEAVVDALCSVYEKGSAAAIGREEVEVNRRELARAVSVAAGGGVGEGDRR